MKANFNDERDLDLDEQNAAWFEWDKRVRRIAHNICKPKKHFKPGDKTPKGDLVEYCASCYRDARLATDLWCEVFEVEAAKASAKAEATNGVQMVPVAMMYQASSGLLNPKCRKALEGYGVL